MKNSSPILFTFFIVTLALCLIIYMRVRSRELLEASRAISLIFSSANNEVMITDSCRNWLRRVRDCAELNQTEAGESDSLDKETLRVIESAMRDVPMYFGGFTKQGKLRAIKFKVNLSNPLILQVWLQEEDGVLKLHKINGICKLYSKFPPISDDEQTLISGSHY